MVPAAIRELRDPLGWAVAALALAANIVLGAGVLKALLVALVVLAVKVGAGALWPRPAPPAQPVPASQPVPARVYPVPGSKLTARELEVASWTPKGLSNKEIGKKLIPPVKERGVDKHIFNIMVKLNVHSREEIAAWYTRQEANTQP
jgi:DNA-binding NarL/FixJ family response regulator